jgi:aryl-phospho-beta-D-glucosidase BglC (GH1 family)
MRKFIGYEKGVNLGGWLSQCCHTYEHYDSFITEKDFEILSGWNIDHVRIPVDYDLLETESGDFIEKGLEYIKNAVNWCKKYNLNMVLDLHKTAGFSFDDGENEMGFFTDDTLQERFFKLWEKLASHFGKYHDRIAFELLNEVTDDSYSDKWNEIAEKCIKRIRKIAPEVYILIGGYHNNSIDSLPALRMPYDDKIVYNFHCYEPIIFTHQGAYWIKKMPTDFRINYPDTMENYKSAKKMINIDFPTMIDNAVSPTVDKTYFEEIFALAVKVAEERNVPLYCGEYGVINLADRKSTIEWYKAINSCFEKYGISRAAWSYKEMDFGLADDNLINDLKNYL